MEAVAGIFILATLIEGLITYIFGESNDSPTRPYIKFVSLAFGIIVSIIYRIDILSMGGLVTSIPLAGYVISGLIIGRGSNYVNDIVSFVKK